MRRACVAAFIVTAMAAVGGWAVAQSDAPAAPGSVSGNDTLNGGGIRFNFRGATYQQVIDFFSRSTGLPVIWQAAPPEGTLDYVSPPNETYAQAEALRVLNLILQSKGVMLRVSKDHLYLQKLDQMQREDIPTFVGEIPADITADQIITFVRPLNIALAKPMAEKLANMVAAYGAVTAMEQQNSLVVTETAANVRRILSIVDQLDRNDPDGAVEVFAIKNAKASELMVPLKALLSQKVEKYVINQQGQQVKIEEDQMPGLTISADDRTNAIVAKGVQNKIDKLREAIALLDVPAVGQGRSITTMALNRIEPAEALAALNQLFERLPEKDRPTVVSLDDAAKVMIVGADAQIMEASLLVAELETGPIGGGGASGSQPLISALPLQHASPQNIVAAITSLLTKRQQAAVKVIAGVDGKSLIVSGAGTDVEAVKALVPVLDRPASGDRQIRLVRIAAGEPGAVFAQARQFFAAANSEFEISNVKSPATGEGAGGAPEPNSASSLAVDLDAESRLVTMIGPARAIELFTSALKQIESNIVIAREARRFTLINVMPSELVGPLHAMAAPVLAPVDGSDYVPPSFTAVDQLGVLIVTATPEQMSALAPLIENLDAAEHEAPRPSPRLLQLRFADAANLASVLMAQYNQRPAAERKAKPVYIGADPQTNALIVAAHADAWPEIQAMVDELNRIERTDAEARELQIYPLKSARAEDLARTIDEMFPPPPVPIDARGRPQPQLQKPRPVIVRAEPQTNSLIISAIPGVLNLTQEMIAQLDIDPALASGAATKSVHVLTIENADAAQIAANLEALFAGPGQGAPQAKPTIRVDVPSNSLLIRATDAQVQTIQEIVAKVDKATIATSRQMRMIAVDPAKSSAEDVARALERMIGQGDGGKVQVITLEELLRQRTRDSQDVSNSSTGGSP